MFWGPKGTSICLQFLSFLGSQLKITCLLCFPVLWGPKENYSSVLSIFYFVWDPIEKNNTFICSRLVGDPPGKSLKLMNLLIVVGFCGTTCFFKDVSSPSGKSLNILFTYLFVVLRKLFTFYCLIFGVQEENP